MNELKHRIERIQEQLNPTPPEMVTIILCRFCPVEDPGAIQPRGTPWADTRRPHLWAGRQENGGARCGGSARAASLTPSRALPSRRLARGTTGTGRRVVGSAVSGVLVCYGGQFRDSL